MARPELDSDAATGRERALMLRPSLSEVLEQVKGAGIAPLDRWHLTTLLEMEGWNDDTARSFGYEDLFDLAGRLYPAVAHEVEHRAAPPPPSRPWHSWVLLGLWHFVRGLVFSMPMLLSSWATLYLGVSLWSYTRFGVPEATGIALATMASFLATGGFTQAMARRGLFYISLGEYRLARRASTQMIKVGVAFMVVVGLGAGLLISLIPVLSWPTIRVTALYYPFLSLIWLFLGLLYMLQREIAFTAVVAVGIAIAYALLRSPLLTGLPEQTAVLVAHAAALTFTSLTSLLLGLWFFKRLEGRSNSGASESQLPRGSAVMRQLFPFWLYGVVYFGFLFVDRFMAWSTPSLFHPQVLTFLGPYELGLNWASLVLLLPMGWVEIAINFIVDALHRRPLSLDARDIETFNRHVTRLLIVLQVTVMALALPNVLGIYALMRWLSERNLVPVAPLTIPVAGWVFLWGAVGYTLLAGGLFNILVLFATNQPWPVVRATITAALTALVVSFLASRFWYHAFNPNFYDGPENMLRYPQAVFGFVAGSAVLWWLAARRTRESLRHADYLLYLGT